MDNKALRWRDVLAGDMKPACDLRRMCMLDLDRPRFAAKAQHRIDLGPVRGPIEMGFGSVWRDRQEVLDHKPLLGITQFRVPSNASRVSIWSSACISPLSRT